MGQSGQRGGEAVRVQPERNERQPSLSQRTKVSIKGACDVKSSSFLGSGAVD